MGRGFRAFPGYRIGFQGLAKREVQNKEYRQPARHRIMPGKRPEISLMSDRK